MLGISHYKNKYYSSKLLINKIIQLKCFFAAFLGGYIDGLFKNYSPVQNSTVFTIVHKYCFSSFW